MYAKITAFFMSGTGNSYKVAKWFSESMEGIHTGLQQIREQQATVTIGDNDLLVFSYPTHGFTAPWLMIKYIFRLPEGNGVHVVLLPTRAGTRILGLSLPGMEGTAGYLIAGLLWLRGYKVRGVAAIDMPSNWTALHWGLSDKNVKVIVDRGEQKVKRLAQTIASGRSFYNGFIPLVLGVLLAGVSFGYLIIGQMLLAKLFFASDKCNGCSLCKQICPKQSIQMLGNKPYWTYSCDSCMACMNFCPQKAIQVSPFTLFLYNYIGTIPVYFWISGNLGWSFIGQLPGSIWFLIQYVYILSSVALMYRLLHHVLRIKPLAALLSALSHTKYFRRYKSPGVSLGNIHRTD